MNQKTKKASEAIRQGYLSLPNKDILDLMEWLFERAVSNGYEGDFEIEVRESLGYQWDSESLTGWAERDGEGLRYSIENIPIVEFAHGAGSLPFYAGLLDALPDNNKRMLECEHKFGDLLVQASTISEHPFLLIKVKFEAFD